MFSGRIGFIAYQQGLGLTGQCQTVHENDDLRAAADAAAAEIETPEIRTSAPRRASRARHLLMNLLAAVF